MDDERRVLPYAQKEPNHRCLEEVNLAGQLQVILDLVHIRHLIAGVTKPWLSSDMWLFGM